MKSMTGFGLANSQSELGELSVEIKSYNSRYLDLFIHLPPCFSFLEATLRTKVSENLKRGKIELNVRWQAFQKTDLDTLAVDKFKAMIILLAESGLQPDYRLTDLKESGIFKTTNQTEALQALFMPAFQQALSALMQFRLTEGQVLAGDINKQIMTIETSLATMKQWAPQADTTMKLKLKEKFKEFVGNEIEEKRLLEETALFLVKVNINEELVRIESHIKALKTLLTSVDPMGRQLDFLAQELNREVNTIGSKTPLLEIQQLNVVLKDTIEKIREQARNIE